MPASKSRLKAISCTVYLRPERLDSAKQRMRRKGFTSFSNYVNHLIFNDQIEDENPPKMLPSGEHNPIDQ